MNQPSSSRKLFPWLAAGLLTVSALLMWLPALQTPFWGDDYSFLLAARASNAAHLPWWSDFWPNSPLLFWRPLSQEGYWRWVVAVLDGSAVAAHAVSLALHVVASLGVALFGLCLARACRWPHAGRIAAIAGSVHAALALHLLPLHWAAAANNAMLTLFTSVLLAAWVGAGTARPLHRGLLLACTPLLLALALLSKESAALTPVLMLVVAGFAGARRPRLGGMLAWLACAAVVCAWLLLRARFTTTADAAYELSVGGNVVRNAASFIAWLLNVPRESLRMALEGQRLHALGWMAATALPMLAAWGIALWRGRARLGLQQWLAVPAFAVLAYGPYFLFAWNSYAYYAAIAVILPVIALARCLEDDPRLLLVAALIAISSWCAVQGSRQLDHPGLIGRARWAEALLQDLEQQPVATPLNIAIGDEHRFYALGQAGLAWRLGIAPGDIHVAARCPAHAQHCLVIDEAGDWQWWQGD